MIKSQNVENCPIIDSNGNTAKTVKSSLLNLPHIIQLATILIAITVYAVNMENTLKYQITILKSEMVHRDEIFKLMIENIKIELASLNEKLTKLENKK